MEFLKNWHLVQDGVAGALHQTVGRFRAELALDDQHLAAVHTGVEEAADPFGKQLFRVDLYQSSRVHFGCTLFTDKK
jgi:hypothetical protein